MRQRSKLLAIGWILTGSVLATQEASAEHQTPVSAISISNTQALSFGKFAEVSSGSVTISPTGARSATGGVVLVSSGGGSAAQFTVSGDPNLTYSTNLPGNGTASLTNGDGQTMALNNFSSSPGTVGQLSVTGNQTLSVGATLNVGSNQAAGDYSGTFDVMVNYD